MNHHRNHTPRHTFGRGRVKRLLVAIAVVWASLIAIASAVISGGQEKGDRSKVEVYAQVDGRRGPIQKGSVIAQADKTGDSCTLRGPVKVGAKVSGDKAIAPVIRWGFDEECRIVIREIGPGTPLDDQPPSGGDVTRPQPVQNG